MKKILISLLIILSFLNIKAQLPDGSIAPDFNLQDINGNYHHLYDILDSGKFVVIDFFWSYV